MGKWLLRGSIIAPLLFAGFMLVKYLIPLESPFSNLPLFFDSRKKEVMASLEKSVGYYEKGQYGEAWEEMQKRDWTPWLDLPRGCPLVLSLLVSTALSQEDIQKNFGTAQKCLFYHGEDGATSRKVAADVLAKWSLDLSKVTEGLTLLEEAMTKHPDAPIAVTIAQLKRMGGDIPGSSQAWLFAINLAPHPWEILKIVGTIKEISDNKPFREKVREILKDKPTNHYTQEELAYLSLWLQNEL